MTKHSSSADGTNSGRKTPRLSVRNHEDAMREPNPATMQFEELQRLYGKLVKVLADK
jgi:hypothetical protein